MFFYLIAILTFYFHSLYSKHAQ